MKQIKVLFSKPLISRLGLDNNDDYALLVKNCKTMQELWQNCSPDLSLEILFSGVLTIHDLRRFAIFCAMRLKNYLPDVNLVKALDVTHHYLENLGHFDEPPYEAINIKCNLYSLLKDFDEGDVFASRASTAAKRALHAVYYWSVDKKEEYNVIKEDVLDCHAYCYSAIEELGVDRFIRARRIAHIELHGNDTEFNEDHAFYLAQPEAIAAEKSAYADWLKKHTNPDFNGWIIRESVDLIDMDIQSNKTIRIEKNNKA